MSCEGEHSAGVLRRVNSIIVVGCISNVGLIGLVLTKPTPLAHWAFENDCYLTVLNGPAIPTS